MRDNRDETRNSTDVVVGEKAKSEVHNNGHGLHMILCVAAMAGALWLLRGSGGGSGYWILFLIACPLMHLFMGHGAHGSRSHGNHDAHDHENDGEGRR